MQEICSKIIGLLCLINCTTAISIKICPLKVSRASSSSSSPLCFELAFWACLSLSLSPQSTCTIMCTLPQVGPSWKDQHRISTARIRRASFRVPLTTGKPAADRSACVCSVVMMCCTLARRALCTCMPAWCVFLRPLWLKGDGKERCCYYVVIKIYRAV